MDGLSGSKFFEKEFQHGRVDPRAFGVGALIEVFVADESVEGVAEGNGFLEIPETLEDACHLSEGFAGQRDS
ncbi:MAG: hypothetical protein HFACDABA_00340 [Anaerolineales bacterium]|nr:hypothetical protein [Anaerolineales bacterium]